MGQSGGKSALSFAPILNGETGIPVAEALGEVAVQDLRPGLKQEVRSAPSPLHLLPLRKALSDDLVHGRLNEATLLNKAVLALVGLSPFVQDAGQPA